MHGWFVCPIVSMVTTSHVTGLEKTLLGGMGYKTEGGQVNFYLHKKGIGKVSATLKVLGCMGWSTESL